MHCHFEMEWQTCAGKSGDPTSLHTVPGAGGGDTTIGSGDVTSVTLGDSIVALLLQPAAPQGRALGVGDGDMLHKLQLLRHARITTGA